MRRQFARIRHLIGRFREMGRPVTTRETDAEFAAVTLSAGELGLWMSMDLRDRRHAVAVAKRFCELFPAADRNEIAAALLHDVGKSVVRLGRLGRSVATVVPVTSTMRTYRRHEEVGADLLQRIGSPFRTVALVRGSADDEAARALRAADDGY